MQVTIEISRQTTKRLLVVAITPLTVLLGIAVSNAVPVPHLNFRSNDVLTADQLNENFANLNERVAAIESASTEHVVRAVIAAGCVLTSQFPASSVMVSRSDPGDCTVTFAEGTFSGAPTCMATSYGVNGDFPRYHYGVELAGGPTMTTARFRHSAIDNETTANAFVNEPFGILCVGPK